MMKLGLLFTTLFLLMMTSCQKGTLTDSAKSTSTSANSSVKEAVPFRVVESAYAVSDVFIKWAAVIENPNAELYGVFPAITVTARDDSGAVIGTQDSVLFELPPGLKMAVTGQLSSTVVPATIEIKPAKVEWKPTRTRANDYKPFGVEKVRMTASGKEYFQVTGDVTNPYDKELESISIVVLLRDTEGKLVGGDTTYVDGLAANGSRPFEVKFIRVKGKPASQEISVYPHGLTSWNSLAAPKQ
jgi:hypothetical protein